MSWTGLDDGARPHEPESSLGVGDVITAGMGVKGWTLRRIEPLVRPFARQLPDPAMPRNETARAPATFL